MLWKLFERYQRWAEILFWVVIGALHATLNALSTISDYQRRQLPLDHWEAWTWELSSYVTALLLIPLIILVNRRFPISLPRPTRNLLLHLGFSAIYSLLHVAGMVAIRQLVYAQAGRGYDFGHLPTELWYEYRKDVVTYFSVLLTIYIYRFIVSRLRGEATVIATGEDSPEPERPERLLIRKLGREFIVRIADIDWVEAAGNYMNLHVGERIYPLRETMTGLEQRLDPAMFARIHRSTMINLDRVQEITPLDSGDYSVRLVTGQRLNFSRRYRDGVREKLNLGD